MEKETIESEALKLPQEERAELAKVLLASLNDTRTDLPKSDFEQRLRNYVDHAWGLAARTLTVHQGRP